jgi:ABC-type nitrate/sulfonate/bicarbonate transport system ATPase subunit
VSPSPAKLSIEHVTHVFGDTPNAVTAVQDICLDVAPGRFVSIIGQSGCGKSTLFNIIAGLRRPSSGRVVLDGRDITGRAGLVAYMLQKDLLLPWRSVRDNVAFGLELQGTSRRDARDRAAALLDTYGLGPFAGHYPNVLSGGMRQRAALMRTLLCDQEVLLLDEPFAALDAQTRFEMQQWLLQLWTDFKRTVLFVTHDVDEAIFLSDEICILSPRPGRVQQRFTVPLPRPRQRAVVTSPGFVALKERCMTALFDGGAIAA